MREEGRGRMRAKEESDAKKGKEQKSLAVKHKEHKLSAAAQTPSPAEPYNVL